MHPLPLVPTRLEGMETAFCEEFCEGLCEFRPDLRGWKQAALHWALGLLGSFRPDLRGWKLISFAASSMCGKAFRPDLRGWKPMGARQDVAGTEGSDPT